MTVTHRMRLLVHYITSGYCKVPLTLILLTVLVMGRLSNSFLALLNNWHNLSKRIIIMRDINLLFSVYTMFLSFAVRPQQILSLIEIIDSEFFLFNFCDKNERESVIAEKKTQLMDLEKKILNGNVYCIVINMTVTSLVTSCYIYFVNDEVVVTDLQLPYPFYFPQGYETMRVYFLAYSIDTVITILLVFATSYCYFSTTIIAITRVGIDFELLKLSLERFNGDSLMMEGEEKIDTKEGITERKERERIERVERCLVPILRYHQNLLRKAKQLEKNAQFVLLVTYQLTCLFDVGNFYCFYKTDDLKLRIMLVIVTVLANQLLFYTCDSGQKMIDASEQARESMYSFFWQNKRNKNVKDLLLIMMIRAHEYTHIQPYGLYTVHHRTFANILQTSYSYLNFLKKFS